MEPNKPTIDSINSPSAQPDKPPQSPVAPAEPITQPAVPAPAETASQPAPEAQSATVTPVAPATPSASPAATAAPGGALPPELKGFNWGAFLLSWIWGLGHGVWISLLALLPFVSIIIPFYLGFKGNELAWNAKHWDSVEQFKSVQKKWMIGGLIYLAVSVAIFILFTLMIVSTYSTPIQTPTPSSY